FQPRHKKRTRHSHVGRGAVQTCGLELGAEWGAGSFTWVATGKRVHQVSLDGLLRSADLVCAGSGVALISVAGAELWRMDQDVQMEKALRARVSLCGAAFHSSSVAHVDRLSRHSG